MCRQAQPRGTPRVTRGCIVCGASCRKRHRYAAQCSTLGASRSDTQKCGLIIDREKSERSSSSTNCIPCCSYAPCCTPPRAASWGYYTPPTPATGTAIMRVFRCSCNRQNYVSTPLPQGVIMIARNMPGPTRHHTTAPPPQNPYNNRCKSTHQL